MYGVVMHEYMRDILSEEFIIIFGSTKATAINKAWNKLKEDAGDSIHDFTFDDDTEVTKDTFKKVVIENETDEDGVYITPYHLYVKLFKVPAKA